MVSPTAKMVGLRAQYEHILHNALLVTETAVDLKERSQTGKKYVSGLRNLAVRATRTISAMQNSAKNFVLLGQRLTASALHQIDSLPLPDQNLKNLKQDFEKLLAILEKELLDSDELENADTVLNHDLDNVSSVGVSERLRHLETKQKFSEQISLPPTSSARSFRSDVDEKYPENWSRESLIDLNNVVNLPPVPEDAFISFSKPVRTSSLSSLKSIRKVKLYLQRAANSEDEESEYDEHELSMSDDPASSSEGGESRSVGVSIKKGAVLCNIKEEAPQEP